MPSVSPERQVHHKAFLLTGSKVEPLLAMSGGISYISLSNE